MQGTEVLKSFHTRIIRRRQFSPAGALGKRPHRSAPFERLDESAMRRRHISAHLPEIGAQHVFFVPYAEHRVESRHDRALGSGFAAELLGLPAVDFDAFVDYSLREIGVILPTVNVRWNPVVVNEWFTPFRHPAQSRIHGPQR